MRPIESASGPTHDIGIADLGPSLEQFESDPSCFHSVALPLLLPGTRLTLNTRNTTYHMVVLDGSGRRVQIWGGRLFPESTEIEIIGATDDESVKVGWIVEGFQLELSTGRGPVLTSLVESFEVE